MERRNLHMEKQQHINPEYFKTGLSPEEYSHLAACPFCCEQFADYIENQELFHVLITVDRLKEKVQNDVWIAVFMQLFLVALDKSIFRG